MSSSEYLTIVNVARQPSVLLGAIPEGGSRSTSPSVPRAQPLRSHTSTSSYGSDHVSSPDPAILSWEKDDIAAWLAEIGFAEYQEVFADHDIRSGRVLLALSESHLKEMGVARVGHRLELMGHLEDLRRGAGLVPREVALMDVRTLLQRLDIARSERHLSLYPKRIILVRHGESMGNMDQSVYATVPDNKLELTEQGRTQAYQAGVELKNLIGAETVTFYVSPFVRSKQTYEQIRHAFHDEQVVCYREDPRLREQEWGNFQDPQRMDAIMDQRRAIGAFYYRFPTGESGADVFDRVSTFLETFYRDMQKGTCGENSIFVSHGLFCRLFLTRFYHWTVERFHKLWNFRNCQFAIMELQPQGHYKLISHLKSDP